ncbi:MAG: site-specific DNA-methyltransferase [Flavobacteriales bacterium]|nr:site-specific DNA-methyltransferase [Flavobacteriales bacterium]
MEEVFGSENFCGQITFRTKLMPLGSKTLEPICDFIIWYCKSKEHVKFRDVFTTDSPEGNSRWGWVELPDKVRRKMSHEELNNHRLLPSGSRVFTMQPMRPAQYRQNCDFPVVIDGQTYRPAPGSSWSTTEEGMKALVNLNRVVPSGKNLFYVLYHDDYPVGKVNALWADTGPAMSKSYVVQSSNKVIERCMLMCSDPGDLVLDPTCGSGTTAFVAEQWGRRWITIDTSRIALNIAKTRLMTASFPNYHLHSDVDVRTDMKDGKFKKTITEKKQLVGDVRQGFVYEEVPHITLKSVANDEPPATETLYDKPYVDNKRVRVSGPFTVETLQDFEPVSPAELEERSRTGVDDVPFEQRVFAHLQSAGVLNGIKNERAIFTRVDRLASAYLHAEGFYKGKEGEKKAYFHIGPKFGSVSRLAVNEAVKECRQRGDADWLVILGFSFETDIESKEVTASTGSFMVTKTRMHDDLMQEGLMKKPKNVGSFITIGEPDVRLNDCTPPAHVIASGALAAKRSPATDKGIASSKTPRDDGKVRWVQVEVAGLDIYDPISDTVKARDRHDINYWMVDDDYDGNNFVVKQVFFCGGDKDEFAKWQRGLSDLSKQSTKRKAELTLKIELDDEAFDRLYGHISHPIAARKGQKIAVRVVSQFGEESTKVVGV